MNSTSESAASTGTVRRKRFWGAVAVMALFSAVMVVTAQPTSAAQTTAVTAACSGENDADKALLNIAVPGGVLTAPLTATVDSPAFVEPDQEGVTVAVSWRMDLPASFADTAIGLGVSSLEVGNTNADTVIQYPGGATQVIEGRPPDQTVALAAGTPIVSNFGPFSATLDKIGSGGLIKIRSEKLRFDATLAVGGEPTTVAIACSTATTIAVIPIKVAGSPDIVQPIQIATAEGQPNTVDVLGEYISNGKTKDGIEQQVDPSTLRIVDGDARIEDGKVVASGPAAGTSTDVTIEVCAGTVQVAEAEDGLSDVQEVRIFRDPSQAATRKQYGVRMALNGEQSAPIWTFESSALFPEPTPPADEARPADATENWQSWWQKFLGTNNLYLALEFRYPSAAQVQAGLESIPGIGSGNVKVTRGDVVRNGAGNLPEGVTLNGALQYRPYQVEFTGELAAQSVSQLTVARMYSFFPSEILEGLSGLAGSLGGGEGEGEAAEEPTPIPEKYDGDVTAYVNDLNFQFGSTGDVQKLELMIKVIGENIGSLIDVPYVLGLLNDIFQPSPEVVTTTNGTDPVEAKFQELCSQGIVTLTSVAAEVETTTESPAATEVSSEGSGSDSNSGSNSGGTGVSVAG